MFKNNPISTVRFAAIALILYYLLNISSETIRVSSVLEQRQYLLQDLIRYFLLLFSVLGFWKLYRSSLRSFGHWSIVSLLFTAIFGIIAYVSLSLNLLLVPADGWRTPLLSFFEMLKGEFRTVFNSFLGGQLSLQDWILAYLAQLKLQFLPQLSDFSTGAGWAKLYLLCKLVASLLLKFGVVLSCFMFLFSRPLPRHNYLIALLLMLWLLSPVYGKTVSSLWTWLLNIKAFNGDSVRNLLMLAILLTISLRMWIDAPKLISINSKKSKKNQAKRPNKKSEKKATKKK